ncbi:MAG: peptide deformylase [Bordetella sp.]|nr:MAG: peptide deformylase [Bordetella sp.]
MIMLSILQYPDPRLFRKAETVLEVTNQVREIVLHMAETMYKSAGIGLAATQVNIQKRIVVIDISEAKNNLLVLINPKIIWNSNKSKTFQEGCLSIPGIYEKVTRPESIFCKALDNNGHEYEFNAEGILSVCVQHEIDHLEGTVFLDHLSKLKRNRIENKLKKIATHSSLS